MPSMADPNAADRKSLAERKSLAARKYLEAALPLGQWSEVSKKIGHNHAFVQQYIRRGKPKFLAEADRNILVDLYDLDPERLKPPAKSAVLGRLDHKLGREDDRVETKPGQNRKQMENERRLVNCFRQLPPARQEFFLDMVTGAVTRIADSVAA